MRTRDANHVSLVLLAAFGSRLCAPFVHHHGAATTTGCGDCSRSASGFPTFRPGCPGDCRDPSHEHGGVHDANACILCKLVSIDGKLLCTSVVAVTHPDASGVWLALPESQPATSTIAAAPIRGPPPAPARI